jgi:hypothetical protein
MKNKTLLLIGAIAIGVAVVGYQHNLKSSFEPQSSAAATTSASSTQAPDDNSITLDLGSPSTAIIYQGDKVISQTAYDKAGIYTIDTSSLPNGTYRVLVKTSGKTAQFVLHQSQIFTKPGKINIKISLR